MKIASLLGIAVIALLALTSQMSSGVGLDQSSIAGIFDHHHVGTLQPGRTARVMSRIDPTIETHDKNFAAQHCEPSKNWNRRIDWRNGSCIEHTGHANRFIERANAWNQVLYFKCSNDGISAKSWQSKYNPHPFGELDLDATTKISTRVVLNGREVGTFSGSLPNTYLLSDLRRTTTGDGRTLIQRMKDANGGILKLETHLSSHMRTHKFSLAGFKRAIEWCEEVTS